VPVFLDMKVTFVSPPLNLSGGNRVVAIYAELLTRRGHEVVVVAPAHARQRSLLDLFGEKASEPQPPSHLDGSQVSLFLSKPGRPVSSADVPDADVVIATWWETAEWVRDFPPSKGAKVYFVQHHEVHSFLPQQRTRSTYRFPLHKIVVARWLAEVIASEYGDRGVDVVPNSVDHRQFFAAPRGKQKRPTAGLLFSTIDWKRFPMALESLVRVQKHLPELHVRCFGIEHPGAPLPPFVSFSFCPAQDALREIYASCDVWLTASSSEGFNLPAMEAMACRTPVVATRTGWPAEAVIDGVNGACVDVDDVDALAHQTERLLRLPDAEWRRVSQRAFDTVRDSSWERSADLFEQALQRVVSRPAAVAA